MVMGFISLLWNKPGKVKIRKDERENLQVRCLISSGDPGWQREGLRSDVVKKC